jgi:hypothetical protein
MLCFSLLRGDTMPTNPLSLVLLLQSTDFSTKLWKDESLQEPLDVDELLPLLILVQHQKKLCCGQTAIFMGKRWYFDLSLALRLWGSSRIRWHTSGHFTKIFMIIYVRINIYFYNIWFLIRLNDWKGLARASFNTPTHRQWHFWRRYRAIFNLLSTFKSHYHIKCSRLNHIVKKIEEIDPYVEKIERFADWLLIWRPH